MFSQTRTFTIIKFYPEDAASGVRNGCDQVYLVLQKENTFKLFQGNYYSDWGDRIEDSFTYKGIYEENKSAILCTCHTLLEVDRKWDHEMMEGFNNQKEKIVTKNGCLKKKGKDLICPIDYIDFKGKMMSLSIEPYPSIF